MSDGNRGKSCGSQSPRWAVEDSASDEWEEFCSQPSPCSRRQCFERSQSKSSFKGDSARNRSYLRFHIRSKLSTAGKRVRHTGTWIRLPSAARLGKRMSFVLPHRQVGVHFLILPYVSDHRQRFPIPRQVWSVNTVFARALLYLSKVRPPIDQSHYWGKPVLWNQGRIFGKRYQV